MKQDFVARVFVIALAVLGICIGRLFVVPLIALIATLASLFIKNRVRYSDADWFSTLVFLFPLVCVVRWFVPHDTHNATWILPTGIVLSLAEFFLLTISLEFFRDRGVVESQNGRELPIHFPAWGLGVLICLMHRSFIDAGPRLGMFAAAFVGVSLAALFFQFNRFERVRRYRQRNAIGQLRALVVVLTVAGLVSWQGYEVWADSDNSVARWIIDHYHEKAIKTNEDLPRPGHLHAINAQRQLGAGRVLLRGQSDIHPLYLRSDVFTQYDGTKWRRSNSRATRHVTPLVAMANAPRQLDQAIRRSSEQAFVIGENPDRDVRPYSVVSIRGSQDGVAMLTPPGVSYASGWPEERWLELDDSGTFRRGFDITKRYTYYLPRRKVERIALGHRNACTVYPRGPSGSDAQRIAILAHHTTADCISTQEKITAIETLLRDNYQLSATSPKLDKQSDKVADFILNKPAATCEYFASAATLLLRVAGVPTRYVTGYATRVSNQGRWAITNQEAHAWAEAYDDAKQQWVTVEPTPGKAAELSLPALQQAAMPVGNQLDAIDRRGTDRNRKATSNRRFRRRMGVFSDRRVQLLTATLAVAMLLLGQRYWATDRNSASAWLAAVERQLRRHQLERRTGETLHQFADRVKAYPYGHQHNPPLSLLADWLKTYAKYRYAQLPADWIQPPPGKTAVRDRT